MEDPQTNDALEVLSGKVRCHSKDRDEVYRKAVELRPRRFAVLYTGQIPKDAAVVLWNASSDLGYGDRGRTAQSPHPGLGALAAHLSTGLRPEATAKRPPGCPRT